MKVKKIETRKGLWICPQCKKQHLGFQRGNKCSVCKTTRLQFIVAEAGETSLIKCQRCGEILDFEKEPTQTGTGYIKCPKCGATLTVKGKLAGKQEGKLNETVDVREWEWHCSRCHSIHTGTESQSACPKCCSELTFGTIPGSHESASEGRMLYEGFQIKKEGESWKLSKRLFPARQMKKVKTKKEEFDSKKFRSFRGAEWTAPNSDSKCRLCGGCGACGKERQTEMKPDPEVRAFILAHLARGLR